MKTQYIVLSFLFLFVASLAAHAQKAALIPLKKENIQVWGECGMCKKKIEKAAMGAGAETASWSQDNKMLAVSYKSDKTNSTRVQEAVAAAGYDTKDITAGNEAYNSLPACCHYERKATAGKASIGCCNDQMGCSKENSCCKDEKCSKSNSACSDMVMCREKGCCKS